MNKVMEYYKSYYLKEFNRVDEEYVENGCYIKVLYIASLGIQVGEEFRCLNEINRVVYYSDKLTDDIKKHHRDNYLLEVPILICEELPSGVKLSEYLSGELIGYSILLYNELGEESIYQIFDSDFKLVEYRELYSNSKGDLTSEKIFFATSWVIHEEDH